MSNQPQIFSPLAQKEKIASNNISLELIEFLGKINLRLNENDSQARDAVEKYLTYYLPKSAGEVTGNNETRVLWLGPNEYLLLSEDEKKVILIILFYLFYQHVGYPQSPSLRMFQLD